MDFVEILSVPQKSNNRSSDLVVQPEFLNINIKDIITRGGAFYAYWDGKVWSSNLNDLMLEVDKQTKAELTAQKAAHPDKEIRGRYFRNHSSKLSDVFEDYCKHLPELKAKFNTQIMFSNDNPTREDYSTTQLDYYPIEQETPAFDEILETLYDTDEVNKILWFMGALLTGSMMDIQKFMYLFGGKGSGKGTVIDIFKELFQGYYAEIALDKLTSNDSFATAQVKEVPLLVDPDSDISRISRDVNLLKLTSHEPLSVNQKFTKQYDVQFTGLLITASNQRYMVRNINSGITRRAVVVEPSGRTLNYKKYMKLKKQVQFELSGIAFKAIAHFNAEGPARYETETDVDMMMSTDPVFDFIRKYSDGFTDPITLNQVASKYKLYLEDLGFNQDGYKRKIREGLKPYYDKFEERGYAQGKERAWNVYSGFKRELAFPDKIAEEESDKVNEDHMLALDGTLSAFDEFASDYKAQYTTKDGKPSKAWDKVTTTLKDLGDTRRLHYVRVPENLIVIDLDLKDSNGNKSLELNRIEAAKFPPTYAEVSKSGNGIHLHYWYEGDPTQLDPEYSPGIEVKVYSGKSSLRRQLTRFNNKSIAKISTGLPIKKEEKSMYDNVETMVWNDSKIHTAVKNNIMRKYHAHTKPSMDFIEKILKDAQRDNVQYDITDLRNDILVFAMQSTHQQSESLDIASRLVYKNSDSDDLEEVTDDKKLVYPDKDLVFFDIEVFKNLLIVCWKVYGKDTMTTWFNPTASQIEDLTKRPLVGFNNRRYDNHVLYDRLIGGNNTDMFDISQQIIKGGPGAGMMRGAYGLAYADVYDFSTKKQSLKKWEVELGLLHDELEHDWDAPIDKKDWKRAGEYCAHDVRATEAVFNHLYTDYEARMLLSKLTNLPVASTTQQLSAKFMFGEDKNPQKEFVYTDLSEMFPGYTWGPFERVIKKRDGTTQTIKSYRSDYRGEDPGEGGYVYSEPGIYKNVVEIDAESMHPTSIINLDLFGPYTKRFKELKQARILVKHHDLDGASKLLDGSLIPYLEEDSADSLAYSLKIIINSIYGLTSAKFPNAFNDPRNKDNIVAKRGALFMIDLKNAVQEKGWKVVHIKTDSIKIANQTPEKIQFVQDFGLKYGYNFAVEHVYDKFGLVNKAVLIGHIEDNPEWGKESNTWSAIGAQYADPYVYKTMFTKEELVDHDFAQVRQSNAGSIHLGDEFIGSIGELYASNTGSEATVTSKNAKTGEPEVKALTHTKGFLWSKYSEFKGKEDIDMNFYDSLVQKGIKNLVSVETEPGQAQEFLGDIYDTYQQL